jgi:hypothetical protein
VRLRILKHTKGDVDGVSLDQFRAGQTYTVGTTLGSYLLALGVAVPVADPGSPWVRAADGRVRAADAKRAPRPERGKKR